MLGEEYREHAVDVKIVPFDQRSDRGRADNKGQALRRACPFGGCHPGRSSPLAAVNRHAEAGEAIAAGEKTESSRLRWLNCRHIVAKMQKARRPAGPFARGWWIQSVS